MPDEKERTGTRGIDPPMEAILEAILYASPEPVGLEEIQEAFGADRAKEIEEALQSLLRSYEGAARGLTIEKVAGGYRIVTRSSLADILREFVKRRNRTRLSRAALETLAMIAYRQPVTAPEIEAVRGVNPFSILKSLLERRLIKVVGRKKVVGRPILYGTTPEFLEHFGLDSVDDLPSLEEFANLLDATRTPDGNGTGGSEAPSGAGPGMDPEDAGGEAPPGPEEGR